MIYFIFLILTFTHISNGNQTVEANHVDLPSFLKSLTDLRGKLIDLMGSFNPDFDTGHQAEGKIGSQLKVISYIISKAISIIDNIQQ